MKKYFWHIKIPTYFGVILLAIVLGVTVMFLKNSSLNRLRAVPSEIPTSVQITNISDSSFTVSYTTAGITTGSISYGETPDVGSIVTDDRDSVGVPKPHQLHYFTVKNLKADTSYFFNILSGNSRFDKNGAPYTVQTGPALGPVTKSPFVVSGIVQLPDGNSPKEAAAYLTVPGSKPISVLAKNDGTYSIIANLRTDNLKGYREVSMEDTFSLSFTGDSYFASATVLAKISASVPTVILSQEYDFTADTATPTTSASQAAQPTIPQFSKVTIPEKIEILVPKNNQPFSDPQPEFSGTGIPDDSITISIQAIDEINAETIVGSDGLWKYRPEKKLEPGVYTLTVTGKNKSGRIQSVSESFVMHAEGSQFTDPSVAPTKSPTPTLIPTLTPTSIPQASPSATIIPTIITPSPTLLVPTNSPIPSTNPTTFPSPQPSIPPPGSNELFISIGLITFATVVSAMLFLLFRV